MISEIKHKNFSLVRHVLLLLPLLLLPGCATLQTYTNCDVHAVSGLPSLHPAAYGVRLNSTKQITINTRTQKFEFISILELSGNKMVLVSLTPLGQKLFQIEYEPARLVFTAYGMPNHFEPAFLLTDLSLMYGEEKALRTCFNQAKIPFTLQSNTQNTRLVMLQRESGNEKIQIDYAGEDIWNSPITYTNHSRDYSITVKPLSMDLL